MGASAWTAFLVPIAIGLSFALFRRLCPARLAGGAEFPLTDEERRVYRRWEAGALVPFFIFAPLLTFAWYLALKGAAGYFEHVAPGTRFLTGPAPVFWALPAIFLGLVLSALPMVSLYRALLGDRYRRYERFCSERVGFDGKRVFAWLAAFRLLASSLL
jgi:hypothetical protein